MSAAQRDRTEPNAPTDSTTDLALALPTNWLQVFRRADAALLGSDSRQPPQTRAVR